MVVSRHRMVVTAVATVSAILGGCTLSEADYSPTTTDNIPATTWDISVTTSTPATTTIGRFIECTDDAADIEHTTQLVGLELDSFALSAAIGDVSSAQIHYENAMLLGEVAIDEVDSFLARCASYARSAGTYNDLRDASSTAKSALAEMRRTCRQELASFGFEC